MNDNRVEEFLFHPSIDTLSEEWFKKWTETHCKPREQLDEERLIAEQEAARILSEKLGSSEITFEPIVFDLNEFSSARAFATAMFVAANHYKDNTEDIVIRYAKPENKATKEVSIQFHILKEKKKK